MDKGSGGRDALAARGAKSGRSDSIGRHFLLVICSNHISTLHRLRDVNTFTVYGPTQMLVTFKIILQFQ